MVLMPKIRSYRPSDLTAMVVLDRMCFSKEFCFEIDSMRRFAEEGKAVAVVAEELDGELAGFVIAEVQTARGVSHGYCVTLDVAEAEAGALKINRQSIDLSDAVLRLIRIDQRTRRDPCSDLTKISPRSG